jgi:hypothetical protein
MSEIDASRRWGDSAAVIDEVVGVFQYPGLAAVETAPQNAPAAFAGIVSLFLHVGSE